MEPRVKYREAISLQALAPIRLRRGKFGWIPKFAKNSCKYTLRPFLDQKRSPKHQLG